MGSTLSFQMAESAGEALHCRLDGGGGGGALLEFVISDILYECI